MQCGAAIVAVELDDLQFSCSWPSVVEVEGGTPVVTLGGGCAG